MTKRVVVFAGYNRKSEIEDNVLYYLKGLREIADVLIYVVDNEASPTYCRQIEGLADFTIFEKHGEYDFGSWKRGLRLARQKSLLSDADELVLCNDSCYGPVFPFMQMFAAMGKRNVDFWGVTKNGEEDWEHVQSYFLVFARQVFVSALFESFFESVVREKTFWDIVTKYEVGLSRLLIEKGKFRFDVYCPIDSGRHDLGKFGNLLLLARSPLVKRKIFTRGGYAKCSLAGLLMSVPNEEVRRYMKDDYFAYFFKRMIFSLKRFVYQDKTTKSGNRIIKICKIPVIVVSKEYDI